MRTYTPRPAAICPCGRRCRPRAKRCDLCRRADPHRHAARQLPQMFVSVDGEGHQDGDVMSLVSMSYGREDGTSTTLHTSDPREALRWLVDELSGHYTDADGTEWQQVPVAFHFNWDMSVLGRAFEPGGMQLVHKARARERGLLCATNHPVDNPCGKLHRYDPATVQDVISDGGEGDLLAWDPASQLALAFSPKRRCYVEHRPHGDRMEENRVLDVHDTGSAFTGGLLAVIDQWQPQLSPAQHAAIEWGKQARKDGFLTGGPDRIAEYSEAECVAHARCCRLLIDAIGDSAHFLIKPSRLFGSGSVAAEAFKFFGVPARKDTAEDERVVAGLPIDQVARMTYFGGMIETPVLGLVTGAVDEVDINSAYPDKMVPMPCMRAGHGNWHRARGWQETIPDGIGHVLASWAVTTPSTPPFIVRTTDGNVRQPLSGRRVWVTLAEYRAARAQFGDDVIPHETLWWESTCECEMPFEFLADIYARRQEIRAEMTTVEKGSAEWWAFNSRQQALKLIINSCYGKLAQQRPQLGRYTNLHYAAHITGATRAQVRTETWAREAQGGTVVYQHTDSVLSVGGQPQDGGPALGAWGLEKPSRDLLILQPGLATSLGGGKTASRGCGKDALTTAAQQWAAGTDLRAHPKTWPAIKIKSKRMISRRLALAQGKPHLAGAFLPHDLTITFATPKRDIDHATPMPNVPTAWIIPPIDVVPNPATIDSLRQYQTNLAKRLAAGEFDVLPGTPTYDQLEE